MGSPAPLAETWMPDYEGPELYGTWIRTELISFLRPERKFPGVRELREQILRDGETAKKKIYKRDIL